LIAALTALALACGAILSGESSAATPGATEVFPIPLRGATFEVIGIGSGLEGNLWFVDNGEGRIGVISPAGQIENEYPILTAAGPIPPERFEETPDYNRYPGNPVLGVDGDMWLTDVGEYIDSEVFITRVTPAGNMANFVIPTSLSMGHSIGNLTPGPEGDLWFTDVESIEENPNLPVNSYIDRITPTGQILRQLISTGHYTIGGIGIGKEGDIWFTDAAGSYYNQSFVGRLTTAGLVTEFPLPEAAGTPSGITLGADGNMWFIESHSEIGRISSEGAISEFAVPSTGERITLGAVPSTGGQIVLGSDGNIWFTEGLGIKALGRITPTGAVTSFSAAAGPGGSPALLSAGSDGELWFLGSNTNLQTEYVGRFVIPLVPVDVGVPVVSGEVVEGGVLSVSDGSWSNGPSGFGYQWQLCDVSGGGCVDLAGEVAVTYVLGAGDVGHTLRAVVTASGTGGSTAAVSGASAVVQAAPPLPPGQRTLVVKPAVPVVGATMTWSFGWTRGYTVVESLVAHGLPVGGVVEVACRGRGCPFAQRRFVRVGAGRSGSARV
jgi:streptogramin lyase